MNEFLLEGPEDAPRVLILTHGAGSPMDSALLTRLSTSLAELGTRVIRFEFPYMAARRTGGKRGMPDPQPILLQRWKTVFAQFKDARPTFIGGHSMGGRMASMVADQVSPSGVMCVSYPWHPPDNPHKTRVEHLLHLKTPCLMLCGTRDEFGSPEEVKGYTLAPSVKVHWLDGADHSIKGLARSPRKTSHHIQDTIAAMDAFMRQHS